MGLIYYIRHGETNHNKNEILTGRINIGLNERGKSQAQITAKNLTDVRFDVVFCSPLLRARQTMKIINQYHNLEIIIDDRLIERDYGDYTGLSRKSIDREISWNYYLDTTKYMNIESVKSVFERVYSFIDFLKDNHSEKTILVVAHSGVGRAFDCYFNGIPEDGALLNKKINNADVVIYKF